eukprot:scaffold116964_cov63-Phaeocystis_antarctica.AAC.3
MAWSVTASPRVASRASLSGSAAAAHTALTEPLGSAMALAMATSLAAQLLSFCLCCSSSVCHSKYSHGKYSRSEYSHVVRVAVCVRERERMGVGGRVSEDLLSCPPFVALSRLLHSELVSTPAARPPPADRPQASRASSAWRAW